LTWRKAAPVTRAHDPRMPHRILILQGHPDESASHFCHALADAYANGAASTGHEVRRIHAASLALPFLKTADEFEHAPPRPEIEEAQRTLEWCTHLVVIFPLWLGTMPAPLKAFLEQTLRPGFAFKAEKGGFPQGRLKGRSARVVVTMGMPAFAYRWFFGAHGVRGLERSILKFCGFGPVRRTLIGNVATRDGDVRTRWLETVARLGGQAR
jgi:putative NADPH-quinone reductase